jgi:DNA-binding MarR family transcriptional regulator
MSRSRSELMAAAAAEIPLFVSATVLFQVAVADQLGLQVSDLHCFNLVSSGLATTPTQIAERMGLTTGAVTKMLDRMEGHRLVRREADPHDRRRLIVRAVDDRADELAELYAPMAGFLAGQLAGRSADQLRFLVEFVQAGREAALLETARLRDGGKPHATRPARDSR